jgi:hypothetical protein
VNPPQASPCAASICLPTAAKHSSLLLREPTKTCRRNSGISPTRSGSSSSDDYDYSVPENLEHANAEERRKVLTRLKFQNHPLCGPGPPPAGQRELLIGGFAQHSHPHNLARRFAAVDYLSGERTARRWPT